ncbi:MAG: protein translocase subunit SecD [Clostridiales Family XIII bacterium]|nr:protein translocase subunit SecD [Clostridiales Family XIII bacterium]
MKKIAAIILSVLIILAWVLTLRGIGPVGPIKDDINLGLDISGGVYVVMEAQTDLKGEDLANLMDQTQAVIDTRVNAMGISESVVTVEGNNRIRIELPGVNDPEQAISTIGRTAQLKFVNANGVQILDGSQVENSGVENDSKNGGYVVSLKFTAEGATAFTAATEAAANYTLAEPFMEGISSANQIAIMLDDEIISAPTVSERIDSDSCIIERPPSGFSRDESIELSLLIRGGALPAELKEVETSSVGATLGMGALTSAVKGGVIGIVLVLLLMLVVYRLLGLAANLALLLYMPCLLWVIVLLGGVLTLPGIAGIILSVGMAVDANVIIYSRIKEEVAEGKSLRLAAETGFKKAMGTVLDAQITTFIAGVVLYIFGTGPVKGFALTLIIGIVIGVLTATVLTNIYVKVMVESPFLVRSGLLGIRENDRVQHTRLKRQFAFVSHRRIYYIITLAVLVVGFAVGGVRGFNFGIDFTGGTMLQLDLGTKAENDELADILGNAGVKDADIVSVGDDGEGFMVRTTQPLTSDDRDSIMGAVTEKFGDEAELAAFEQFGPSIGNLLKKNAVKAVLIASAFMLLYIIVRFRWRFGVAAIIATFHDVAITVALYGLFNMTINNPFIAAILTLVGYSINDTIVVFDRIRENLKLYRKTPFEENIDNSVNQTLVRSIMTSLTTVMAIIPLLVFGGSSIQGFVVPLIIGIVCGTLSSIFIASPLYYNISVATTPKLKASAGKYDAAGKKSKTRIAAPADEKTDEDKSGKATEGGKASEEKPGMPEPAANRKKKGKKSKSQRKQEKRDKGIVV